MNVPDFALEFYVMLCAVNLRYQFEFLLRKICAPRAQTLDLIQDTNVKHTCIHNSDKYLAFFDDVNTNNTYLQTNNTHKNFYP